MPNKYMVGTVTVGALFSVEDAGWAKDANNLLFRTRNAFVVPITDHAALVAPVTSLISLNKVLRLKFPESNAHAAAFVLIGIF